MVCYKKDFSKHRFFSNMVMRAEKIKISINSLRIDFVDIDNKN
jgi:hypothetical protein